VDEVELDVLARRHMRDPVRVLLGQVGEDLHLLPVHRAERDLDP